MPPQLEWPMTMMWRTRRLSAANSSAADTPWNLPVVSKGGTRFATLRTTNNSPGMAEKMVSGSTRLSQHETTMTSGVWPRSASSS